MTTVTPMIHVPDVKRTVDWYKELGFDVVETYGDGRDGLSFAILSFGSSRVMFNSGGKASDKGRREVDLYIYTDDVETIFSSLKPGIEVINPVNDTHYGMREFVIRDINGFWITFGRDI